MDGSRFDHIARTLAGGASRRGVLGGLLGLGAGLLEVRTTEAATCPPGQVARPWVGCVCRTTGRAPGPGGCPCSGRLTKCNGLCVETRSNPANCGGCGVACGPDEYCRAGTCIHRQGTCETGADYCAQAGTRPCNPDSPSDCACFPTTRGATFCGDTLNFACQACDDDDDCVAEYGPGAACVTISIVCTICEDTGKRACMAPCPPAP